jgi:hypothetical protein
MAANPEPERASGRRLQALALDLLELIDCSTCGDEACLLADEVHKGSTRYVRQTARDCAPAHQKPSQDARRLVLLFVFSELAEKEFKALIVGEMPLGKLPQRALD